MTAMRGAHSPEAMKLRASGMPGGVLARAKDPGTGGGGCWFLTLLRSVGAEPFTFGLLAQSPGDVEAKTSGQD